MVLGLDFRVYGVGLGLQGFYGLGSMILRARVSA